MSNLKKFIHVIKILLSPFPPWSLRICWTILSAAPMVLLCFSGSFVALIVFHCPENKVMIPGPGICALYKRTITCCSPNCSMFQADCVPCRCPSPVCALFPLGLCGMPSLSSPSVTVLPSLKAFLLSILQSEISSSLNINCTWFVWALWHLLHIDSRFIIHDLCFSSSLLYSKSFHSRAHVDSNSASGVWCHSAEHTTSPY